MISQLGLKQLSAPQRAELIYSEARSELSNRLWRAAIGNGHAREADEMTGGSTGVGLDSLLALFSEPTAGPAEPKLASSSLPLDETLSFREPAQALTASEGGAAISAAGLGPNAKHQPTLESAAERTGIPAAALAAIVNAEAAKGRDGSWQLFSRNPRSSAAGLGQFLSSTWEGMAETKGTWLNEVAREKNWLGANGQVTSGDRSALLSLRYDAEASINTIADYASQNLKGLRRAGVAIGTDADGIARSAYLGHHLGLGDAIKFMRGGIEPGRARMLLGAQIGSTKASQHIASAGDATAAHRSWFMDYVNRNIRPERFAA